MSREDVIHDLFHLGYSYLEILAFLWKDHNIGLSTRHLIRILRSMGLRRRSSNIDNATIINAIATELDGTGCTLGYRLTLNIIV